MLDNFSVKVLRYIKKHPNVKADDIKNAFSSDCNANIECLCKENYITCKTEYLSLTPLPKYDNSYKITPKGISYLEELPKNRFYRIYPLIISTLALLISLIALLKSFGIIFS